MATYGTARLWVASFLDGRPVAGGAGAGDYWGMLLFRICGFGGMAYATLSYFHATVGSSWGANAIVLGFFVAFLISAPSEGEWTP